MACRVKLSSPTTRKATATTTTSLVVENGNHISHGKSNVSSVAAGLNVSEWKIDQGSETQSSALKATDGGCSKGSVVGGSGCGGGRNTTTSLVSCSDSNTPSTLSSPTFSSSYKSFINSHQASHSRTTITMAGDIRVVDGKKQRKLWTLHDRSMMSVHLVKANLAEEGCEEAQLDVAKKLLQDSQDASSTENTQNENARMAIYWLVKSSEQGNEEATRLLEECLSTGRGITSLNIFEVRTCINTPLNEKLTYKAARILYFKLNNEEKFITTTQLLARIQSIKKKVTFDDNGNKASTPNPDVRPRSPEASSSSNSADNFHNLDNFPDNDRDDEFPKCGFDLNETFTINDEPSFQVESNLENPQGILSSARQCQSIEYLLSQDEVKMSLEDLLKAAGSHNSGNIPQPSIDSKKRDLPRHEWSITSNGNAFIGQLLILAALTGAASLTKCVLLGAAFLGVWSAYNLILWRRRLSNFRDWSEAFRSALRDGNWSAAREGNWSPAENETKLTKKSLLPYLGANLVSFLILSSCGSESHGTIWIIVGSLTVASLLRSRLQTATETICSWQSIFLACAMLFSSESVHSFFSVLISNEQLSTYLSVLPDFEGMAAIKVITDVFPEIPYNLDNRVVLITIVAVIKTSSCYWNTTRYTMQNCLPDLLGGLWVLKIIQLSSKLEVEELIITGIISAFLVMLFILLETYKDAWKIGATFLVIIFTVISLMTIFKISIDNLDAIVGGRRFGGALKDIDQLHHVDWEDYDSHCHRTAWNSESIANTQFKCSNKYARDNPTAVNWKGRIVILKAHDIQKTINGTIKEASFEITVNIMPVTPKDKSWTIMGGSEPPEVKAVVNVHVSTKQLKSYETQEKKNLIDYITSFKTGDKIQFHGMLEEKTAGAHIPTIVNVVSMKCIACSFADYEEFKLRHSSDYSVTDVSNAYWDMFRIYLKE